MHGVNSTLPWSPIHLPPSLVEAYTQSKEAERKTSEIFIQLSTLLASRIMADTHPRSHLIGIQEIAEKALLAKEAVAALEENFNLLCEFVKP